MKDQVERETQTSSHSNNSLTYEWDHSQPASLHQPTNQTNCSHIGDPRQDTQKSHPAEPSINDKVKNILMVVVLYYYVIFYYLHNDG